jgi:hypothetical protein
MKKGIILIIILILILLGFVLAPIINTTTYAERFCTEKACLCSQYQDRTEVPCNTCGSTQYYYFTGLLNLGRNCKAQEIIICEDGSQIDRKLDDFTNCEIFVSIFGNKINR